MEAVFTQESSLRGLFDDLYDAKEAEFRSATKWQGNKPVKRTERAETQRTATSPPEDGDSNTSPSGARRAKSKHWYIYDVVQPQGHFLRQFTGDENEIWHKLWQDMLWAIPRAKPTTRGPFNARAAGKPSGVGERVWRDLLAMQKATHAGESRSCEVAGSVLLGAQAVSAEAIPFRNQIDQALLLHFWQLTARVFVPEQVTRDGTRNFAGYVVAIPEVAHLPRFRDRYQRSLGQLDPTPSGYRPRASVISLPAQGALEFMGNLARLAGEATSADRTEVARTVAGVEFFHMVPVRKNVKIMSHGRVASTADLLQSYDGIRRSCRNPQFLSARLLALLRNHPSWYAEFPHLLATGPWPHFVHCSETPRQIPSFAWDALSRFNALAEDARTRTNSPPGRKKVDDMSDTPLPPITEPRRLDTLVHRLVKSYVHMKTEQKSGHTYESFKDKKVRDDTGRERIDYPRKYLDAQEKVCGDLFLGLRSRRDADFVSFFTGTIGSVPQGTVIGNVSDFGILTQALLDPERWQDVKTLAMLATCAASYVRRTRQDQEHDTSKETER